MNIDLFLKASVAIQIHLLSAFFALGIGSLIWVLPKGTNLHKLFGRGFVGLMVLTAISAVFIREANDGNISIIHIFVPITLFGSYQVVIYIRQKNIKAHMNAVKGLFFGALIIPGLVALVPDRLIWRILFS